MERPDRHLEDLEVLSGRRGRQSRPKAAVRLEDLAALCDTPARLNAAEAAGATPTKAEFDALRAEVERLRIILHALAGAIGDRQR